MMIFKYPLEVLDSQCIHMPEGSKILCVQVQRVVSSNRVCHIDVACLWAIVEPDEPVVARQIEIRGTGHPMNGHEGEYIGTFQLSEGALVFHVFERKG